MEAMARGKNSVLRFYVQAPDGRCSAEWRVWTGTGNTVSNELYATPRNHADHFKFSLHSDGYSQFGFSKSVRDKLRPGDRGAIERWSGTKVEVLPGWRVLLTLQFPQSQLRLPTKDFSPSSVAVPTSGRAGTTTFVMLAVGTHDARTAGLDLVGLLDRRDGQRVAAIVQTLPIDVEEKLSLQTRLSQRIPLVVPGVVLAEPFDWMVDVLPDGTRAVTEFAAERTSLQPLPQLSGFRGNVYRWQDGPEELKHLDLACGAVVYRPNRHAELYVDQHSRCDHSELGRDGELLLRQIEGKRMDREWGMLADGSLYTLISTRTVLDFAGIDRGLPIKE